MQSLKRKINYLIKIKKKISILNYKDDKRGDLKGYYIYIVDHYNDDIKKIGLTTNLYKRFKNYKTHAGKFKMYYFTLTNDCNKKENNSTILRCRETDIKHKLENYKLKNSKRNEEKYKCDFYIMVNEIYKILETYIK
jgi:hypothetical protein